MLHISLSRSHVGDELILSIFRTLSTSGVGMTSGVFVLFLDVRLAFVHTVVDSLLIFLFFGAILENRKKTAVTMFSQSYKPFDLHES